MPFGHGLPVWGFTAHAQPRERELCLAAGMNDCLFKPIGLACLRAALATLGLRPEYRQPFLPSCRTGAAENAAESAA